MIPSDWEILVANKQRARNINLPWVREFLAWLLVEELSLQRAALGVRLAKDQEMARIHRNFMRLRGPTDVITFDHGSEPPGMIHGELFVGVETAIAQAVEFRTTWQSEVVRYIIHGVLHLLGHDDLSPGPRAKMKRRENQLVARAAKRFDFAELEGTRRR